MAKLADGDEVAVYTEDGRRSDLATFHGWTKRPGPDGEDAWHAHVMVYGPRPEHGGGGQYRDVVPAERIVPLVYCGRYPTGEIAHRCEGRDLMRPEDQVWA